MQNVPSKPMFDRLIWQDDRVLLDELVFRLEHFKNDSWELGDDCFVFYKIKSLIDQYATFWSSRAEFRARNILELGLWDGGSIAFWFEHFQPHKHVGVDLSQRGDSVYFRRYIAARGLEQRIATHWGVNQADAVRLRDIVAREFAGPLDLVIDDASHIYGPTKASFETLFPLLRPAGLYVIEDWAWAHWQEFQTPNHPWATETAPTKLIGELIAVAGSSQALIASISVFQGFVVVERGAIVLDSPELFKLDDFISDRPNVSVMRRIVRSSRRYIRQRLANGR
jgi:hypothetical protein